MGTARKFRENAAAMLRNGDMAALRGLPGQPLAAALFQYICDADPDVKWRAVAAMGEAVARLADSDMEAARTLMQRLVWSLNHESGGIGWGAAESLAEAMAHSEPLAAEFQHLLVSFLSEDGYDLNFPPLRRGALWAVARLAEARPGLPGGGAEAVAPFLDNGDAETRGLAILALGRLGASGAAPRIEELLNDNTEIAVHEQTLPRSVMISELAADALARLNAAACGDAALQTKKHGINPKR